MTSKRFFHTTLITLIFTLAACQAATPAAPTATIAAQATPTSAPTASPTPASLSLDFPSAAWDGLAIKELCLDVTETYSQELSYATAAIHRETAARLLQGLGFDTPPISPDCDASLQVLLGYTVNSSTYDTHDGSTSFECVVGASFDGMLLLSAPGRLPLLQEVSGEMGQAPAVTVNGCPDQVYAFDSIWSKTFLENLASLMGPQVITFLYHNRNKDTRNTALDATEALGPEDMSLLPVVLQALKDHPEKTGPIGTGLQKMGPQAQLAGKEAVPGLVQRLKNSRDTLPPGMDPFMGYQETIELISHFGPAAAEAVPLLVEILKDPDARSVQESVIQALGQIGPGAADAIPELMKLIDDPFMGPDAARALGKIGRDNPQVLSFFIEKTKTRGTIGLGIAALVEMTPSTEIVRALIDVCEDKTAAVYTRNQAIDALGKLATTSPEALQAVITASADSDPGVASSALRALGTLGPLSPQVLPAVQKALARPDERVQWAAADAIGSFGADAAGNIPALITLVNSPRQISLARIGAVGALGRLGQATPEVIAALASALKTAPLEAAEALERLGPAARVAVPDLIAALRAENVNPDDYRNQFPFVRALSAVTGEYHGFKAEDWQAWWDAQPKQ